MGEQNAYSLSRQKIYIVWHLSREISYYRMDNIFSYEKFGHKPPLEKSFAFVLYDNRIH